MTIPVTAAQREIALRNLEEQGLARPMQYDDPDVPQDMLAADPPDPSVAAKEAAATRSPGFYAVVR